MKSYLIIDFDSTFVTLEALDELANIALSDDPDRTETVEKIKHITDLGMVGQITFDESLARRLALITITRDHINQVVTLLKKNITPSFLRNKDLFLKKRDQIYIISGGFRDCIWPVVKDFGIAEDHLLANEFLFNAKGTVVGFDKDNPLSKKGGKVKSVESLDLTGPVIVVGDGMTDYEIRREGYADQFIAFSENVSRPVVVEKSDKEVHSFEELLTEVVL